MRLLLDIGNTRLKWAWYSEGRVSPCDAIVYNQANLAEELAVVWQEFNAPQDVWIVSVAKQPINDILNQYCHNAWGIKPNYVQSSRALLGVTNAYRDAHKLGCDRWVAMLAAYHQEQRSVMIVDCGTAVTIDAIDEDGQHVGGVIAPGIALSNSVLNQQTDLQWQAATGMLPDRVFATSTTDCIAAGIAYGIIGLIEKAHHELTQHGQHPGVYLTGGDAAYISHALAIEHKLVDDLVLQGLAIVANHA